MPLKGEVAATRREIYGRLLHGFMVQGAYTLNRKPLHSNIFWSLRICKDVDHCTHRQSVLCWCWCHFTVSVHPALHPP